MIRPEFLKFWCFSEFLPERESASGNRPNDTDSSRVPCNPNSIPVLKNSSKLEPTPGIILYTKSR
eukprot:scaffold323827_cov35-Tisochrysis_lutea.AAC.1